MKKIFLAMILSFIMFYSMATYAAEFKFKDGTLIRGEIQGETLRIKTKFGELTPKVSDIAFVSAGKIELTDGSQIMGELLPEAEEQEKETSEQKGLLFKTKYGTFELFFSMEDIEYIDFKK